MVGDSISNLSLFVYDFTMLSSFQLLAISRLHPNASSKCQAHITALQITRNLVKRQYSVSHLHSRPLMRPEFSTFPASLISIAKSWDPMSSH